MNNEYEKLAELFIAGNFSLTIELCEGLGYDYIEFLKYVWDNYKEEYDGDFALDVFEHVTLWHWVQSGNTEFELDDRNAHNLIVVGSLNEALRAVYKYLKENQ